MTCVSKWFMCGFSCFRKEYFGKFRSLLVSRAFIFISLSALIPINPAFSGVASSNIQNKQNPEKFEQAYADWTLSCIRGPATTVAVGAKKTTSNKCEIVQTVTAAAGGKPVQLLELGVSPAKDKAGKVDWALVVLTPLDVLLSSDFGLEAGHKKPELFRYRNCNHLGCFAVVPLGRKLLAGLKRESKGATYFRLLNGQAVKVVFSLKGFSKAFDALESGKEPEPLDTVTSSKSGQ